MRASPSIRRLAAARLPAPGAASPRRLLPIVAVGIFAVSATLVVLAGAQAGTLGYDYRAYDAAARRLLAGRPLYDMHFEAAGGFGLYYYPPPFVLAIVPLVALLPVEAAVWLWTAVLVAALLAGIAVLPVAPRTRWLLLALAGIAWPATQSIKLGQVGPILLFFLAVGWRRLASDATLGVVAALGALVKVQPGLLFGWALLARRWRAVAVGAVVLASATLAVIPILGAGSWGDFFTLLTRVSDPITTPGNATLGALADRAGLGRPAAVVLQWVTVTAVVFAWLAASLRCPPVPGYLATIVASQLLSPTLWDHYGILLLLPVAWLLERRRRWSALLLLAAPWPLVGLVPPIVYPVTLLVALGALLVEGLRAPDALARATLAAGR